MLRLQASGFEAPARVFRFQGPENTLFQRTGQSALFNCGRLSDSMPARRIVAAAPCHIVRCCFVSVPMNTSECLWVGAWSESDRAQIDELRRAQAQCVATGDVARYASLCTDDVASFLAGHDAVVGRENFIAFQSRLFQGVTFPGMRKAPIRIERSGDLAVEIGRQENDGGGGGFAKRQKYVHVMRKTPEGWRFSVLTSNNSVPAS